MCYIIRLTCKVLTSTSSSTSREYHKRNETTKRDQNTQQVKNERFLKIDKTKQCANFRHPFVRLSKATYAENLHIVLS